MEKEQDTKRICKSIFKSGENEISKEQFTKMWTDMINKIEKGKLVTIYQKE